ncbi:rhomboid family intramembrane serine protease [Nannocystaceae bacterium ST9]
MRELARLSDRGEAQRLADVLLVAGIASEVREGSELWVLDDRDLPAAKQQLAAFTQGQAPDASKAAAALRERAAADRIDTKTVEVGQRWRSDQTFGIGPITIFLIAASVLVGFASDFGDPLTMTVQNLSIEPWDSTLGWLGHVRAGEVWRLVTPMLIHFGVFHLLFNVMWTYQLGRQIEHEHGSLAMIGLILLGQIPSGLGQYLATGPTFGGLSGVVYALFGFAWMHARYDRRRHYRVEDSWAVIMMVWFVVCATGLVGPVANVGHAGGLLAGLLAGTPAYFAHLREALANPKFTAHSWASTNVQGWPRFAQQYFRPYVPLWMLAIAAAVLVAEFAGLTGK